MTKKYKRIVIKKNNKEIKTYPAKDIDNIVIFGKITITPHALDFLLKDNIDVVFISYKGVYKGRLIGSSSKNVPLKIAQYEAIKDEKFKLNISKEFIYGKIRNSLSLLQRINWEHKIKAVKPLTKELRKYLEISRLQTDIDKLRGIEGIAANIYYDALRYFVKNKTFFFFKRSKRPPEDPANAIMSFLYTMLYQLVESAIYITGLDPYLGFFHTLEYSKPSLSLDIMEEFRPIMDRIFLRMVNRNMLKLGDFYFLDQENKKQGVYLAHSGLKKVISEFQEEIDKGHFFSRYKKTYPLRNIIIEQVKLVASAIQGEKNYEFFKLEV